MVCKVDEIEDKLGIIIEKIETAQSRMANVEKSKQIKREAFNKILNTIIEVDDGCKLNSIKKKYYFQKKIGVFFAVNESERKSKVQGMVKAELKKLD